MFGWSNHWWQLATRTYQKVLIIIKIIGMIDQIYSSLLSRGRRCSLFTNFGVHQSLGKIPILPTCYTCVSRWEPLRPPRSHDIFRYIHNRFVSPVFFAETKEVMDQTARFPNGYPYPATSYQLALCSQSTSQGSLHLVFVEFLEVAVFWDPNPWDEEVYLPKWVMVDFDGFHVGKF